MTSTLTKSEILADEGKFQSACSTWVSRHIGDCVSSLMYDVGQNLKACSRIFDFDYEEATGWFQQEDWAEAVCGYIDGADLEDLETVAEMVGWWDDVLTEAGVPDVYTVSDEDGDERYGYIGCEADTFDDEDDAIQAARESVIDEIREKVKQCFDSDDEYREAANELNLDPNAWEVYEHWIIPKGWIARELRERGEVVFDFGGMTIWGRMTTGQSIALDGVIRDIVRNLDEDHWVWREVR